MCRAGVADQVDGRSLHGRVGQDNTDCGRGPDGDAERPAQRCTERLLQGIAGTRGVLELQVARIVGVDVAKGAVQLGERDFNGPTGIGDILSPEHHQRAVTGSALGVASHLNAQHLGVGRLDGFIGGEDLRAGARPCAKDPERLVVPLQPHHREKVGVDVRNDEADGITESVRADELGDGGPC